MTGDALEAYLGAKANKETHDPPNPNYYDPEDEGRTLLHFNRKKLVEDIYAADQPVFKDTQGGGDKVEVIKHIPDAEIDQLDLATCKKELNRRGFNKPPFNVCVMIDPNNSAQQKNLQELPEKLPGEYKSLAQLKDEYGAAIKVAIQKEQENDAGYVAFKFADTKSFPKTSSAQGHDLMTIIAATVGADAMADFKDGVTKVRKIKIEEAKGLLKLIGHDPRFKSGQPVVQPSYFERQCRNCECCVLFWLYWIGMLIVMGIAVTTGDPYRLIRPVDLNGDTCGSVNLEGKEQLYYFQLGLDALNLYTDSEYASTCTDRAAGCFTGICVDGCPKKGTVVCDYEMQSTIDTACGTSVAEPFADCVERAQREAANDGNGCWFVPMSSVEIFKRCLPWEPSTTVTDYSCQRTEVTLAGETRIKSEYFASDNCPCGGDDMMECTAFEQKDRDTETCLPQADYTCLGTATQPATCTGTPTDAATYGDSCDRLAVAVPGDCPDGCAFTAKPKCDLDPATDGTGRCPAGCDHATVADPDTTCEIDTPGVYDGDTLLTDGTCRLAAANTGSGDCKWHVDSQQRTCSASIMQLKMQFGCKDGVIHRTQTQEAAYQEGTEEMSGTLTTYSAWLAQAGADVYNSYELIILMGPVLAAVAAFLFIFLMSYFAGLLIWTTLIALQFVFIAITLFMSWQCGYLQDALEGLVNTTAPEASNDTWAGVAGDGATTAQAFLESYSAFGEQDAEATESNEIIWMIAFWVSLILTIVYFFALLGLRQQIKLAIELIKEAGRTVRKMPMALFYPLFTYALSFVVFIYFLSVATYIITSNASVDSLSETYSFPNASFDLDSLSDVAQAAQAEIAANRTIVAYNSTAAETNNFVRGLFVYHLFGYYWVAEFIKAIGMLTIAGAICSDYWITNDSLRPGSPVAQSFWRSIRYHAGSAVYGAAIIAIIRLWRAIMMYVDKQTQELQKANKFAMIAMKMIHCCLWCLEKIARYISNAAFIMIAIEGRGFCVSAWRSFKLLFSNSLRIATTESIALLIIWLANVGITACCVMLTMLALNNLPLYTCIGLEAGEKCTNYVDNALIPSIFVALTSFMIAYCFMQVYGMAITTILLSFCLDEDKFKNGQYKGKLNDEGEPDGRMFCVMRGKIGLIKLVSPNIQKEQAALEAKQSNFAVEQAKLALKSGARP